MATVLERLPNKARIVIIRLRSLGDCVLTTPAIRILKAARPDVQISIVVEDPFRPVFEGNPDLCRIVSPSISEMPRLRPDLVLNLHGGTRSAQLTMACRSRLRAGFKHFRFSTIYNVRIPTAQEILGADRKVHTAEHLASAMFYLGVPPGEIPRAQLYAEKYQTNPRPVIHAMASEPGKTWPAENFKKVATFLRAEGLDPIFIAGPNESLDAFNDFERRSGAPLSEIKSLISSAPLFVGNDSGPAHIAAAFGVPAIVLFGPSDHEVWYPWKCDGVVLKDTNIANISAERVIEQAVQRIPARRDA